MAFPMALADLLLVPTALAVSIVPDTGVRLVCSVEAVAASIQHLEEVPMVSTALLMLVPMAVSMSEVAYLWEILHMASSSMREIPITVLRLEFIT
jgi:hypothetical protein